MKTMTLFGLAMTIMAFNTTAFSQDSQSLASLLAEFQKVYDNNQALGNQAAPLREQIVKMEKALEAITKQIVPQPTINISQQAKEILPSLSTPQCQLQIVSKADIWGHDPKPFPHLRVTKTEKSAGRQITEWLDIPLDETEVLALQSISGTSLDDGYALLYRKNMQVNNFFIQVKNGKTSIKANAANDDKDWVDFHCSN